MSSFHALKYCKIHLHGKQRRNPCDDFVERRRCRLQDKCENEIIDDICFRNSLVELAEEYIDFCIFPQSDDEKKPKRIRLPNICGFFRWLRLSASALDYLKTFHKEDFRTLLMIFEDEALNSPLPPSIISAYMKQSFSSEENQSETAVTSSSEGDGCPITLIFDHDICNDGL